MLGCFLNIYPSVPLLENSCLTRQGLILFCMLINLTSCCETLCIPCNLHFLLLFLCCYINQCIKWDVLKCNTNSVCYRELAGTSSLLLTERVRAGATLTHVKSVRVGGAESRSAHNDVMLNAAPHPWLYSFERSTTFDLTAFQKGVAHYNRPNLNTALL